METRPIFILLALLASYGVFAAEAYKWIDEDGVIHFSDKPRPGAEVIDLGTSDSRAVRPATPPAPTNDDGTFQDPPPIYENISVETPAAEETLWNIGAVLDVTVSLQPALQPGHRIRAYLDGSASLHSSTRFRVQEVYRGSHNLQVEVIDRTGTMIIRSEANRFYVQQNSIL